MIRTRVKEIREMAAHARVTLINLDKGDKLAGLSRIAEPETPKRKEGDSGAEDGQE